ncbi:MAG: NosD domain-containing protein [Candidatus Bathyarchaeia archaeon]
MKVFRTRITVFLLSICMIVLLVLAMFAVLLNVPIVLGGGTIYIRADGSIDPPTAPITTTDNVTYKFTDDIFDSIVVERNNIVIDGSGYTLQGGFGSGITLSERSNVTIKNTNIMFFQYPAGIWLNSSSNNRIYGNNITYNYYGIHLESSSNNNIFENNISNSWGIVLSSSSNNSIYDNNITNNNLNGIMLHSSSSYNCISGNNIKENQYGIGLLFSSSYNRVSGNNIKENQYGIVLNSSPNNSIYDNNIANNNDYGVRLYSSSNSGIVGNNIANNNEYGIWLDYSSNNIIFENNITENSYGIRLSSYSDNNSVSANNLINNNGQGIWLDSSSNNRIYGNNITNNWQGIWLSSSSASRIYGNNITNNNNCGVLLESSPDSTIFGNNITNDNDYGVRLYSSSNSGIVGNNIANNSYGINILYSDGNLVHGNEIRNSSAYGLYIRSSEINLIYGNSFINSDVDSDINLNSWDYGYPAGGNYWGSYLGTDANGDGIGDTPYVINEFNQDNFPLMSPVERPQRPLPLAFFSYRIDLATNNVTFDASGSYDAFTDIVDFSWDFGDGQSGKGMIVSHVYNFTSSQSLAMKAIDQTSTAQDAYDVELKVTNTEELYGTQKRRVCRGNIEALYVQPMQVFTTEGILVHSKCTAFRIGYNSTFKVPVRANIKLDAPGYNPKSEVIRNLLFNPGYDEITVRSRLVPVEKPEAMIRVIIDPENAIGEANETDNISDFEATPVNDTKPLRVLFVPVRFKDEDGDPGYFTGYSRQLYEEHGWESMKYVWATFPVVESETSYYMSCFNSPVTAGERPKTKAEADAALKDVVSKLAAKAGDSYDRVVGVVRADWFDGIPGWSGTLGYMYTTVPTACVVTIGYWKTTAHELGHTYDLDHSNENCQLAFYIAEMRELNDTQTWMSTGAIANPPAKPGYRVAVPGFWVRDEEYKLMMSKMRLPNDPELLSFSATFCKNGTVKPDTWYRIMNGWPTYTETDTGNYTLVQLDGFGTVLSTVGFNVTFENVISDVYDHVLDEVPVAFTVPYAAGAKTIQIRDQLGNVVASRIVSDNAPTVSVTSPNGGEILTGDHVQVSWTASDIDGDPLVYSLEVSGDGGATWDPVATGLTQTPHDLVLTGFRGGDKYLVKVIASDGVNTAEDISNGYFTIASFSVEIISEPEPVQIGGKAYVLLKVASYGGFSNPITLHATCSSADQLGYKWIVNSTVNPIVNGYMVAVLEVTFNTTKTGIYTLYLSGSSGSNTEVAAVDYLVELAEAVSDTTPPITNNNYNGLWHNSDFTITLTATDNVGVNETYYRINNGSTQSVSADGQPYITTEGANNTLEYWSIDNADNEESHHVLTGIKLDKTIPNIKVPIREPSGDIQPDQPVKISVNVTDTLSQVKNVTLYYTLNNGTTWELPLPMTLNPSTSLYEATIPGKEAGTWIRYKIIAYDYAGNNATLGETEPYLVYQVVPEFSPILILPLFIATTLIAAILYSKKQKPH